MRFGPLPLSASLKPAAPCQNLNLRRVQKLWLDSATHVPVRDQTHFERRTPGPAVTSDVTASIRSTTPA